jgi:hypothetical protein
VELYPDIRNRRWLIRESNLFRQSLIIRRHKDYRSCDFIPRILGFSGSAAGRNGLAGRGWQSSELALIRAGERGTLATYATGTCDNTSSNHLQPDFPSNGSESEDGRSLISLPKSSIAFNPRESLNLQKNTPELYLVERL